MILSMGLKQQLTPAVYIIPDVILILIYHYRVKKKEAFIALPVVVSTIVTAILMPLFLSLSSPVPVKILNGRGPESTCRELMGDVEAVCSYKGVGCGVWGAHLVSIHS